MTEFETIKNALERINDNIVITKWENLNEALIEDMSINTEFWFKDDKLVNTFQFNN